MIKILKNAVALLIPCFTYMIIKTISGEFSGNLLNAIIAFFRNPETNLWFLWVLFVMNFFFFSGVYCFRKTRGFFKKIAPYIAPIIIAALLLLITFLSKNGKVLSIQYIAFYYPFFCFGFLFKNIVGSIHDYLNKKTLFLSNALFVLSAVVLLVFILIFKSIQSFPDFDFKYVMLRYIGSIFGCVFFVCLCGYLSKISFVQGFSRFGQYSLEIYYLHILFWKSVINISFSDFEIVNFFMCSIILLAISAGLIALMFFVPFLHLILFGKKFSLFDERLLRGLQAVLKKKPSTESPEN